VNQHNKKWDAMKDKVAKFAALVGNVRMMCEEMKLDKDDLPCSLPTVLQSLKRYIIHS